MSEQLRKLMEHVEQIAQRENCFLYDLEMPGQGPGRALRIFIDKEGDEGVSIDDCSKVSQSLNLVLDVEDLVPGGAYQLEVSSPGLERRLTKAWHFEKAIGEKVSFQLNRGLGEFVSGRPPKEAKRKKLTATIEGMADNEVKVKLDGEANGDDAQLAIPMEYIHKAKVLYSFENHSSPKKTKGKRG